MSAWDSARQIVGAALDEFGGSLAVLTSFQREGVVIVDLAMRIAPAMKVLTIDTGRLPEATHKMIAQIENRYAIQVEKIRPDEAEVASMVEAHGKDLFYDGVPWRTLCCNVRKVRPLAKVSIGACFVGLRRGQGDARAGVEEVDRSGSPVKISPLASWTAEDVAAYTLAYDLPEHPLYAIGYTSIGCEPCTRPVKRGEDERAGRWWWENDSSKECGLHFTSEGKVERTVDVLLKELLGRGAAA